MEFLEKDLETIIWESDKEKLESRGLSLKGKMKRQLKIGNYGICDLLEIRKEYCFKNGKVTPYFVINVIELKKDKIGISAFLQAVGYVKGIREYLDSRGYWFTQSFEITLIGKDVDTSGNFVFLEELINTDPSRARYISSLNFYTYKYGIDGLQFDSKSGYGLTNKGF